MAPLVLWVHWLLAGGFAFVAAREARSNRPARAKRAALLALAATALWLIVATVGQRSPAAQVGELAAEAFRNFAWLWAMAGIAGGRERGWRVTPLGAIYVGIATLQAIALAVALPTLAAGANPAPLFPGLSIVQMVAAAGGLVLVHNLLAAANGRERSALAPAFGALGLLWAFDLNLHCFTLLIGGPPTLLIALRPLVVMAALVGCAIGIPRLAAPDARLSRPAAFRSIALVGVGAWLLLLGAGAQTHPGAGLLAQLALITGALIAASALLVSTRLRAHARVLMLKYLFEHRYDYRAEWLRFTDTLHRSDGDGESVASRALKAVADIVEARGGAIFVPEGEGWALGASRSVEPPAGGASVPVEALATALGPNEHVAQFSDRRHALPAVLTLLDQCEELRRWWIAVPLIHFGEVEGLALLTSPAVDRQLDWEDLDLLKVAGRQAASVLAESRAATSLAEVERFEEFHRRFAFVMHDVKNLASQMTVLARNAQRHGDNADFRRDMVTTLRLCSDRLETLTRRLAQQDEPLVSDRAVSVEIDALALAVALRARSRHAVEIHGEAGRALGDPAAIESILVHLIDNAIDSSDPADPVTIWLQRESAHVRIEIVDRGRGMSESFIRRDLFRPFASTKEGGFGIGAYQARRLAEGQGGRLDVTSREGAGTRFTLTLPADLLGALAA